MKQFFIYLFFFKKKKEEERNRGVVRGLVNHLPKALGVAEHLFKARGGSNPRKPIEQPPTFSGIAVPSFWSTNP
jgi:hypothetical protein